MAAALPPVTVPVLERLSQLAMLNIKQTSRGYHGNNYTVLGEGDEVLLTLNEIVPDTFFRGGAHRSFQFNGVDSAGRKLFSFVRPRTKSRIFISKKVKLYMNEALVSVVHLAHAFSSPMFNITDALDNPVIRLKAKSYDLLFFQLQTNNKTGIGAVQKKFRGWKKEFSFHKDAYMIHFPADLAVPFKIAVIAACVFLDFRYFEGE